ncbi:MULTISPECIES: hypothetical protein [unclassified Variovorax]|uniref:hypothetical protein n=1 Tax=unclassified Variovorax TaxID=663243 RepID=UPI00116031B8|nr:MULTISPECIES: hypothetical protein [unclassified Variovorax]
MKVKIKENALNSCDVYLMKKTLGRDIFSSGRPAARGVVIDENCYYQGFLGYSIDRLLGVALIMSLRRGGIDALNVPIRYRDGNLLSLAEVAARVKGQVTKGSEVLPVEVDVNLLHPMRVAFKTNAPEFSIANGEGGGRIVGDRLDGHIWSDHEQAEYAYDYNNLL